MGLRIITKEQLFMNDRTRQSLVAASLVATVALNGVANGLPLNGQTTGQISNRFPLPITPAGYVFAIWGLIYSGLIGYVGYQALPGQARNPRLRRIGPLFMLSCVANMLWLLLWHYNRYKLTLPVMLTLLGSLIAIVARLDAEQPAEPEKDQAEGAEPPPTTYQPSATERLLVDTPFRIYLGWISVATIVNAAVVLYDAGWDGFGLDKQTWTAMMLGTGAALAGGQAVVRRDAIFPLVLAWAFVGVARKQPEGALAGPVGWATAAASLIAAGGALLRR
jgi:translocator protein